MPEKKINFLILMLIFQVQMPRKQPRHLRKLSLFISKWRPNLKDQFFLSTHKLISDDRKNILILQVAPNNQQWAIHIVNTSSHSKTEVKLNWARTILGREFTWKLLVREFGNKRTVNSVKSKPSHVDFSQVEHLQGGHNQAAALLLSELSVLQMVPGTWVWILRETCHLISLRHRIRW